MKILKIVLHNFIRFQVANIKHFEAEFDSPITIITGRNGYAKSSVLNELYPYDNNKSLFTKTGYKELTLEYENDIYELRYSREMGHLFIQNGTNLNKNGTNGVQRELIYKYLKLDRKSVV